MLLKLSTDILQKCILYIPIPSHLSREIASNIKNIKSKTMKLIESYGFYCASNMYDYHIGFYLGIIYIFRNMTPIIIKYTHMSVFVTKRIQDLIYTIAFKNRILQNTIDKSPLMQIGIYPHYMYVYRIVDSFIQTREQICDIFNITEDQISNIINQITIDRKLLGLSIDNNAIMSHLLYYYIKHHSINNNSASIAINIASFAQYSKLQLSKKKPKYMSKYYKKRISKVQEFNNKYIEKSIPLKTDLEKNILYNYELCRPLIKQIIKEYSCPKS